MRLRIPHRATPSSTDSMKRLFLTIYFTAYILWAALYIGAFTFERDWSKMWIVVLALGLPFLPLAFWRMLRNVR
jgi:lysylphosphatidylglycerol synthetase-like protein (DUF2156 family)